jgi:hypothetical protein
MMWVVNLSSSFDLYSSGFLTVVPQKFSLEFFLKADVEFKPQANSLLPVLKLHSRTMMSELFTRGGFDVDLKQLEEVFRDDIAAVCAERHFSWEPVSVTPKSGEY